MEGNLARATRLLLVTISITTLAACAVEKKDDIEGKESISDGGRTPVYHEDPVPGSELPPLNDTQKDAFIGVFDASDRMEKLLTLKYRGTDYQRDALDDYLISLTANCTLDKASYSKDNATYETFALLGDTCPLLSKSNERTTVEGTNELKAIRDATGEFLITGAQFKDILRVDGAKIVKDKNMVTLSMPEKHILGQSVVGERSADLVTDYGAVQIVFSTEVKAIYKVEEKDGDLRIIDILRIEGKGATYRFIFPDFKATLHFKLIKDGNKIRTIAYLNGRELNSTLQSPDTLDVRKTDLNKLLSRSSLSALSHYRGDI